MVLSWENCIQMYKPEFKVYKWDFSAEKSQLTRWIFLSIDHSRTVHNVQSSSTLFMHMYIFDYAVNTYDLSITNAYVGVHYFCVFAFNFWFIDLIVQNYQTKNVTKCRSSNII